MESSMVDIHKIIKDFFKKNLSNFSLVEEYSYSRYWGIIYIYKNLKIKIDEEKGIMIDIFIDDTQYSLWQYDRRIIDRSKLTEENVLFQLNILKDFLSNI